MTWWHALKWTAKASLILSLALPTAWAAETFRVLQNTGTTQRSGGSGIPWVDVHSGDPLPLPTRLRTGTQTVTRLWLRPMTRLALDEKTTARLSSSFTGERQVHQVQVEEGRLSLETPNLEGTFLVEVIVGPAVIRFGRGKLLVAVSPDGSAQVIPAQGECHVSAQDLPSWEADAPEDRLTFSRGVGVKAGERLLLRDLRFTKRGQEKSPEGDWAFAYPALLERPATSPTYLDPRGAWQFPPTP